MSKILKSVTLGNVKNGGIFKALGKEFVKLDTAGMSARYAGTGQIGNRTPVRFATHC